MTPVILPGEDADGTLKRLQLETLRGGDEIPSVFARVEKHCRQLWTEGCETAAVIKGKICICVNQAEGVSQQS